MKRNQLVALLLSGAVVLGACGNNKNKEGEGGNITTGENTMVDSSTTSPSAGGAATLDTMDANFAMQAASSDMLEIQSSNMAMQNGSSDRVKAFATTMIRDHGQTSSQLKTLVTGKNVTLPAELMPMHRTMLDNLQGKTGKDFDKAYMTMQVNAHQAAVDLFQRASNSLTNPDLKGFATQHLPHLRMHLDSAQAIK